MVGGLRPGILDNKGDFDLQIPDQVRDEGMVVVLRRFYLHGTDEELAPRARDSRGHPPSGGWVLPKLLGKDGTLA